VLRSGALRSGVLRSGDALRSAARRGGGPCHSHIDRAGSLGGCGAGAVPEVANAGVKPGSGGGAGGWSIATSVAGGGAGDGSLVGMLVTSGSSSLALRSPCSAAPSGLLS
jgi:hypothetical protein